MLLASSLAASAEGFRNPTLGTFGLGRSGARIAQVDDSTAIQHNPANLAFLSAPDVAWEQSLVYASTDFTRADGATTSTENPWKPLANLFAAWPIRDSRWAFGLGVTMPYGLSSEWKEDPVFRYAAPQFAQLTTINFNPTVAYRLADNFAIAGGLDVAWSELTLKKFYYPWGLAIPGAPDAEIKVQGDGVGVSGNLGLTWEVAHGHRLAFTCRFPMEVNYEGHFTGSYVPTPVASMFSTRSSFNSEIQFPTIVGIGYGVEVSSKVRLGADLEWLEFSRFKSLPLTIGAPWPTLDNLVVPQDWKDTITFGLGGDWQFAPNWYLRASYQYFETPVPDSTFSPTIPDSDQHVVTVGITWRSQHHELGFAYSRVFYLERQIAGDVVSPAFNGTYDFDVHLLAFSYRFRF